MSHSRRRQYQKNQFSDSSIEEQIQDELRRIREKNLKNVEQAQRINELYSERKKEKKQRKMLEKEPHLRNKMQPSQQPSSSEEEEGQLLDEKKRKDEVVIEGVRHLGEHIRPLLLTRNKLCQMLNSRRFQQLVKHCFVRYRADAAEERYVIAQVVGVTEGTKEYRIEGQSKTKVLLKLQDSETIITLSIQLISNQQPTGLLEIEKWLQSNRTRIPSERELKEKLEQLNRLLIENLSAEEIQTKIFEKAKSVAESNEDQKQDITHLVEFLGNRLHSLDSQIEELQLGRKETKTNLGTIEKQRDQTKEIYEKIKIISRRYFERYKAQENKQEKNTHKLLLLKEDQKRNDRIYEKVKAKNILFSTYEGLMKLQKAMFETHLKYGAID